MKNLKEFGVKEINSCEAKETNGGKVPFWAYLIAPGTAYLISRFEDGCECDVM